MAYDFDEQIDRRGTGAVKLDYGPVAKQREEHPDLIPLWVADMDLPAPEPVVRALRQRAEHPVYGYTLVPQRLIDAFRAWHLRRHGTEIAADEILTVTAVMPAVQAAIDAFTEPGDGVVIQTPVYFPFYDAVSKQGRSLQRNPLRRDETGRYRMDLDDLRTQFRNGAKMLLLCSPHNPVGRVWSREELTALSGLCREEGAIVVSDEIHCDITLHGKRFTSMLSMDEEMRRHSVVTTSPSKTFNIAGTSCAQLIVPDAERRRSMRRASMARGIWMPNLFGVTASEAAYAEGEPWLDELLPYLSGNDAVLREEFAAGAPDVQVAELEGTFIPWLDFTAVLAESGKTHDELRGAIEQEGVWLSDGRLFGSEGEGFQRINIAASRTVVREAARRIIRAVRRL